MKRPTLEDLVADFVERRESGEAITPQSFLEEHPGLEGELRPLLDSLTQVESLLGEDDALIPERLGSYRILGEISRGGMGLILEAVHDDAPSQPVALKVLLGAGNLPARSRERFRREAQALEAIDDPAIVRVLAHGFAGRTPYLAMERLEGKDLSIRQGDAESTSWVEVGAELARAVTLLHARGILHRDLKPANVVLRTDGQPVLVDFGLASGDFGTTLTRTGELLGTPSYMSPEQARGEKADERTDVWGLGAILHQCLTGCPPHPGTESLQVLDQARHRPVTPLREGTSGIPRDLCLIVNRCLAWLPDYRYPSAAELEADLRRCMAAQPVQARAPGLGARMRTSWATRRPATLTAMAIALVLLASLLVYLAWPDSKQAAIQAVTDSAVLAWVDGDQEDALRSAQKLLALAPEDRVGLALSAIHAGQQPASEDPVVQQLYRSGRLLGRKKGEEALPILQQLVEESPRNALAIVMLSSAAREAGRLDLAERELTAAMRILPDSPALLSSLAWLQRKQRRWGDAEKTLQRALILDADGSILWRQLAIVHFYQDRYAEALAAVERALELREGNPPFYDRNLHATLLDRNRRFEEAEAVYRDLLLEKPGNSSLLFNLAYSMDSDHRLLEARELYLRLSKNPKSRPRALSSLAWMESGSDPDCEDCRAAFRDHPELRDDAQALAHCLDAVRACRGRDRGTVLTAVDICKRLGKQADLRGLLQPWFDSGERSDKELLLLSRALRDLKPR